MPSSRPCAAFEPISPDFDVKQLVETTLNFDYAARISYDMVEHRGVEEFERLVRLHVINGGKPLVIEGYQNRLDEWTFALQWLRDNCASKVENARDLTKKVDMPLSIGHYLNHMAPLTNQWNDKNYKDHERQRMYLKDIDCPQLWQDKLKDVIPLNVFYLNETIGDVGGLGSLDEDDPSGAGKRKGRGVAKSGDLMASLPKEMRADNLMCYIGHEGTYTPAHKEMCASLGQNIMVETSTGAVEDGKPTKPGSSLWFMTETKEREVVSEYWLSKLGHDIEVEKHFAQINAWRAAPFKTYVVEQRVGDLILIPPLAPHQVWNRGTRTMKVAWNRTTVETLDLALRVALPAARMVCRDEQYKNKAIVYYSLQKYSKMLKFADKEKQKQNQKQRDVPDAHVQNLRKDFRKLQTLFTEILISESFFPAQNVPTPQTELVPFDGNITCSYCRANIFNRFLTCPSCIGQLPNGDEDTYDICMDCYAMGRSCACISKLMWVEQFPWGELVQKHEQWRHQILQAEGKVTDKSPKSLRTELERLGKQRTLAQICQIELSRRPFNDITKPNTATDLRKGVDIHNESETELDIHGNPKKKKTPRRSQKFNREHARCHVDGHWEPIWKQAQCSSCDKAYCFGILFRGYDEMPQDILANPDWQCPSCRNICSCKTCKNKPKFKPHMPQATILGHNTKAIADPRSVESLVSFGYSNLSWIQKAGDDNEDDTRRMKKRQLAAEKAKAQNPDLDDIYAAQEHAQDADGVEDSILLLAQQEGIPIDPALCAIDPDLGGTGAFTPGDDEEDFDENPEEARPNKDIGPGGSSASQYFIPTGGVIRDAEHAYDDIEAITYDYPDPETGLRMPAPLDAPVDASVSQGYEPAVPSDAAEISMINRKQKKGKIDEGDGRPLNYNKPNAIEKPKKRKSLIVKLCVDKTKLAHINSMVSIAQQALNGVAEAEPPVISSDLRALNAGGRVVDGQPLRKKARIEDADIDEEDDDEFKIGRYRDRRKVLEREVGPPPGSDIPRRVTRKQAVTYEEPSDGEDFDFDETLPQRPRNAVGSSKLTTLEQNEKSVRLVSEDISATSLHSFLLPETTVVSLKDASKMMDRDDGEKVPQPRQIQNENPASVAATAKPVIRSNLKQPNGKNGQQANSSSGPSKAALEAIANRRAKLAAVEWAENNSSDVASDNENSEDEPEAVLSPPKQLAKRHLPFIPAEKIKPTPAIEKSKSPNLVEKRAPKAAAILSAPVQATKANLPKVSAAEWGDYESSEDDAPARKVARTGSGWAAVKSATLLNLKHMPDKRPRGRPAQMTMSIGRRTK